MGKNRDKSINLDSGEKTILFLIANLNSSKRQFPNEEETAKALDNIRELVDVLDGKAHRVATCILNMERDEKDKIKNYAQKLIDWAKTI